MQKFITLLKKYGLRLSDNRKYIIHPDSGKKIQFYWDDVEKSIMEIENFHPNINAENEILEVLEEQILRLFFNNSD